MEIEEKKWCVYIHRCKISNKAYIGIAKGDPKQRWGSNEYKYTKSNMLFIMLLKSMDGIVSNILYGIKIYQKKKRKNGKLD